MKPFSALLAAAPLALFSAGTAVAEEVEKTTGYYFTIGAGAAWSENVDGSQEDYASRWSTGEIFYGSIQPKFDLNAGLATTLAIFVQSSPTSMHRRLLRV